MNNNLTNWKNSGRFFHYQGHKIFYTYSFLSGDVKHQKDKPTLLCIHGFPMSSWDWSTLWPELTSKYHVLALDQLGFGFSDKPPHHQYSIVEQTDITEALLNQLNIKDYHLLAHDFGTLIAQELLDRDQERSKLAQSISAPKINKLIAMSGSIFPELSNPRLIQKLLISRIGFLITKLFNQKKFNQSMTRVFFNTSNFTTENLNQEDLIHCYWQLLNYQQGHKLLHQLNFFLKDRKYHGQRWADAWQASNRPIRYIVGLQDPMYGNEVVARLKHSSKQQDIHVVDQSGHFPHIECPAKVLQLITDFI